jgi:flavodoxin
MKIAVLYDSYYGNNKQIAETIAGSFQSDVTLSSVKDFQLDSTYDLLVLGCPTRGMRPTKPMVTFIKKLRPSDTKKVAIYDTRMDKTTIPRFLVFMMKYLGHAIETMEKKLLKKDKNWILDTNYFEVIDGQGPLGEGQIEKAQKWAKSLQDNLTF